MFEVASAGVSAEEYGEPVYPPIGAFLRRMGIDYSGKRATVAAREDMTKFDYIVVMEDVHAAALKRKFPWADFGKVYKLNDFKNGKLTGQRTGADIEDPWYTENYGRVFDEILKGCRELAEYLCENAKSN